MRMASPHPKTQLLSTVDGLSMSLSMNARRLADTPDSNHRHKVSIPDARQPRHADHLTTDEELAEMDGPGALWWWSGQEVAEAGFAVRLG